MITEVFSDYGNSHSGTPAWSMALANHVLTTASLIVDRRCPFSDVLRSLCITYRLLPRYGRSSARNGRVPGTAFTHDVCHAIQHGQFTISISFINASKGRQVGLTLLSLVKTLDPTSSNVSGTTKIVAMFIRVMGSRRLYIIKHAPM